MQIENILSDKQQAIVPIAAFTAGGDLQNLKNALSDGLDKGLTINEIKEVQMHLYAYAGFPRCLNGLATFMQVLDARRRQGINDPIGQEASPLPSNFDSLKTGKQVQTELSGKPVEGSLFDFAPYSNELLQKHLFGDLFARDILDFQTREIATVAALSNMSGVTPQLQAHIGIALNTGLTHKQLQLLASILKQLVNEEVGLKIEQIVKEITSN